MGRRDRDVRRAGRPGPLVQAARPALRGRRAARALPDAARRARRDRRSGQRTQITPAPDGARGCGGRHGGGAAAAAAVAGVRIAASTTSTTAAAAERAIRTNHLEANVPRLVPTCRLRLRCQPSCRRRCAGSRGVRAPTSRYRARARPPSSSTRRAAAAALPEVPPLGEAMGARIEVDEALEPEPEPEPAAAAAAPAPAAAAPEPAAAAAAAPAAAPAAGGSPPCARPSAVPCAAAPRVLARGRRLGVEDAARRHHAPADDQPGARLCRWRCRRGDGARAEPRAPVVQGHRSRSAPPAWPPIVVKFTATLEGGTHRLALPDPITAYLHADHVRRPAA